MVENENRKEMEARQALEPHLAPGEQLLAYASGNVVGATSQPYYLGLTAERLLMLPLKRGKPSGEPLSLLREVIKSLTGSGWLQYRLQIKAPQDTLTVVCAGRWVKRAKDLVSRFAAAPPLPITGPATAAQRSLRQARDFMNLGLLASAQQQFKDAMTAAPSLATDSVAAELQAQLAETRLALRVGAGFCFGNIGVAVVIFALLALLSQTQSLAEVFNFSLIFSLLIDLYVGLNLWQGKAQWRGWALARAILGLLFYGFLALSQSDWIGLVTQIAFSGSFIILLTGKSARIRTWLAVGLYVFGYLGITFGLLLFSFIRGLLRAL